MPDAMLAAAAAFVAAWCELPTDRIKAAAMVAHISGLRLILGEEAFVKLVMAAMAMHEMPEPEMETMQ